MTGFTLIKIYHFCFLFLSQLSAYNSFQYLHCTMKWQFNMVLKSPILLVQNSLKFVISSPSIKSLPIVRKADMVTDLFLNTDSIFP